MLIANFSNGFSINLAEEWKRPELERLRDLESFHCPVCEENVLLRLGTKRIWHFAHLKDAACDVEIEPESTYHLLGKRQLYQWLAAQNHNPLLEEYFPDYKQRPDLFIPELSTAIEYQCSAIPTELFQKRTRVFQKNQIDPLWILGGKRLSHLKNSIVFRLDELAFQSIRFNDPCRFSPYLIYYCPLTSAFTLLHSIVPYSSRTVFAFQQTIPLKQASFPIHMNEFPQPDQKEFHKEWIEKLVTTRLYLHVNNDPSVMMMKKHLIKKGIPISLFPVEAGIPTKHLFWFHTPAYVWQTCFLLEILHPLPIGASFQFRETFRKFNSTLTFYKIKTRRAIPDEDSHISYALMDYLQWLCRLGVLKRIDVNHFMKKKELNFPVSITEVRQTLKGYYKM